MSVKHNKNGGGNTAALEKGSAGSKGGGRKYRRPSFPFLQGTDRAGSRGGNERHFRRYDPAIGGSDRLSGIRGRARLQHSGRNHQVQRAVLRNYRAAYVERRFLYRRNDLRLLRLVELTHTGTIDDPIPYPETAGIVVNVENGNITATRGKSTLQKLICRIAYIRPTRLLCGNGKK